MMLSRVSIEEAWPHIEEIVRQRMVDDTEASPEDMYEACKAGVAVCLRNADGFLVTWVQVNGHTSAREYVIWWGSRVAGEHGAFERVLPEVRKAALATGCENIVFYSPLKGWLRKAPKAGFRVRNVEYVLPVERGH